MFEVNIKRTGTTSMTLMCVYCYHYMLILWSHVLHNLLPGHPPETWGKRSYEAIGKTLQIYQQID